MLNNIKPTIEPKRNGPLQVKNLKKFKNSRGEDLNTSPSIILCRCGESKNKPYCDGAHTESGFTDRKNPRRVKDKMVDYKGKEIIIHDNRGVCSHRENCIRRAPRVFHRRDIPWIEPDAQDADKTAEVIETCPSGALSYSLNGILHKDWDQEPGILICKNGPYDVQGYVKLIDPDGNQPESEEHYTLCRCGHSRNKPFCDGRHWRVRFKDPKN